MNNEKSKELLQTIDKDEDEQGLGPLRCDKNDFLPILIALRLYLFNMILNDKWLKVEIFSSNIVEIKSNIKASYQIRINHKVEWSDCSTLLYKNVQEYSCFLIKLYQQIRSL